MVYGRANWDARENLKKTAKFVFDLKKKEKRFENLLLCLGVNNRLGTCYIVHQGKRRAKVKNAIIFDTTAVRGLMFLSLQK